MGVEEIVRMVYLYTFKNMMSAGVASNSARTASSVSAYKQDEERKREQKEPLLCLITKLLIETGAIGPAREESRRSLSLNVNECDKCATNALA